MLKYPQNAEKPANAGLSIVSIIEFLFGGGEGICTQMKLKLRTYSPILTLCPRKHILKEKEP